MPTVTRKIFVDMDAEGNIDIRPTFVNVPNGPDSIILRWEATGIATFPETDYFAWKAGEGQPAVHWRNSQLLESDSYVNDASNRRLWRYWINVNGVTVDPEVNNQPPDGGGMPAGQVGQPGGGQPGGGQPGGGQQGGGQSGGGQSGGGQQGGGGRQPGNP